MEHLIEEMKSWEGKVAGISQFFIAPKDLIFFTDLSHNLYISQFYDAISFVCHIHGIYKGFRSSVH